jgi:hypothetical protein
MSQPVEQFIIVTDREVNAATIGTIVGTAGGVGLALLTIDTAYKTDSDTVTHLRSDISVLQDTQSQAAAHDPIIRQSVAKKEAAIQTLEAHMPKAPSGTEVIGGYLFGPIALGAFTATAISVGLRRRKYNQRVAQAELKAQEVVNLDDYRATL